MLAYIARNAPYNKIVESFHEWVASDTGAAIKLILIAEALALLWLG